MDDMEEIQLDITNWELENLGTDLICCVYSRFKKGRPISSHFRYADKI